MRYCRGSRFLKWCGSDIPEHQKQRHFSKCLWLGVTVFSCCLPVSWPKKPLVRAESRGMKAGRVWSLFRLAWLLKTTLCNFILNLSMQLHRYSHTLCGEPYLKMCMNTVLHPKLECLDLMYKGSIGTAVPALVTWDFVQLTGLAWNILCCMSFGNYMFWEP